MQQVKQDQKEVRGLVADLQVAVDKLKREVTTLESEADQLQGRGRNGRGSTTTIADLDKRVAVVENRLKLIEQSQPAGAMVPPPATSGAEQPGLQGEPPPIIAVRHRRRRRCARATVRCSPAALAGANVDEKYREALPHAAREALEAVPLFREFLRKNPGSDFADDAQFYIGECYYSTRTSTGDS
jgi:TolA-binding protein